MEIRYCLRIITLLFWATVRVAIAQDVVFEFASGEGFRPGDIANHRNWQSIRPGNVIGASPEGRLQLNDDTGWVSSICAIGMAAPHSRLSASMVFRFREEAAEGGGDIIGLQVHEGLSASVAGLRLSLRRSGRSYWLHLFYEGGEGRPQAAVPEIRVKLGFTASGDISSDPLRLSVELEPEEGTRWTVRTRLSNEHSGAVIQEAVHRGIPMSTSFSAAPYLFFGFNSCVPDADGGVSGRVVDRFSIHRSGPDADDALRYPARSAAPAGLSDFRAAGCEHLADLPDIRRFAAECRWFSIPAMLADIERETEQLEQSIAELPALSDSIQIEAYGYHGGYLPAAPALPDEPRWTLDFEFSPYISLAQLVLVPAVDHRFRVPESYGFPRRFRVLGMLGDGSEVMIAEWMTEDAPDPGRFPVILDLPVPDVRRVRIEVFRGASDDGEREYIALDELYGVMGGMDHLCHSVRVSSEFKSLPYWDAAYLIDQRTGLGLPLDVRGEVPSGARRDFNVRFDGRREGERVVELDLGRNCRPDWVTLFPAQPPEGLKLPGYGFPGRITMEIVEENSEGGRGIRRTVPWDWRNLRPGNNVVQMACGGIHGRWLRLVIEEVPVHNGRRTFALGEIQVSEGGHPFEAAGIRLIGFPDGVEHDAARMVDGRANGYPVLFLLDWLHKIERRNALLRMHGELKDLEDQLHKRWRTLWRRSGLVAVMLVAGSGFCAAAYATVQRRRYTRKLRMQISSDLHDDIGSKVAAISLASNYVESNATEPRVKKRGARIHAIAADMHQALRDVLWLTDTRTDTLDQLFRRLVDSARKMVAEERLILKTDPLSTVPVRPVKVEVKRDILLCFKEALHNAAVHSGGDRIEVDVLMAGRELVLRVADNGRGFDPAGDAAGEEQHGLMTMQVRSHRLHGRLNIDSSPGQGTTVALRVHI